MATSSNPSTFVRAKTGGEMIVVGTAIVRIMEDGSRTDNRMGSAEVTLPPGTKGPPPHLHELHNEAFLVTQGKMDFHFRHGKTIFAQTGDYLTVPPNNAHAFSNPYEEEAKFFLTFMPADLVNYFRLLSGMGPKGVPMDPENNRKAMARFATFDVPLEDMKAPEKAKD